MQHQDLATCGLFAAFHLSPKLPPDPPSIPPFALKTFCLPHTHVPPYRKKSQVSKRHSQPDQLTRCLPSPPSPLPEQAGEFISGPSCCLRCLFPRLLLAPRPFGGISRGFSLSLTALSYYIKIIAVLLYTQYHNAMCVMICKNLNAVYFRATLQCN